MDREVTSSVVLLYHRLGLPKLGSLVAGQYVAPRLFRSQLDYLTARGWRNVRISESIRPDDPSDGSRFAVTFDDGYLSVYEHACPALAERSMTATVYVVAGAVGGINEWDRKAGDQKENMMSAGQIRELAETGFDIGSHTMRHPRLTTLSDEEMQAEIEDSKKALEDIIGREVTSFSYPYGDYDGRVLEAAIRAGYADAVTTRLGMVIEGTSPFEIPRVNVRWNAIGPLLARKIGRARRASGLRK